MDIYKLLQPRLMIVTRGREGADFVFKNKVIPKKLINSAEELDPTGAGDAFFSVFIKEYFGTSREIDDEFIHRTFYQASSLTADVVKHIGARGHIYARILDKIVLNDEQDGLEEL